MSGGGPESRKSIWRFGCETALYFEVCASFVDSCGAFSVDQRAQMRQLCQGSETKNDDLSCVSPNPGPLASDRSVRSKARSPVRSVLAPFVAMPGARFVACPCSFEALLRSLQDVASSLEKLRKGQAQLKEDTGDASVAFGRSQRPRS